MPHNPPRHIRDIAHLYLSRMRVPRGRALRLVVAGVSPDVVPGFHAANLAVAAAADGIPARIVDVSGLPVNAGCFLGLDPRCWVANGHAPEAMVRAFARVSFTLGTPVGTEGEGGDDEVAEIVHAPPWNAGTDHLRVVRDALVRPAVLLYLAERDGPPRPWLEWRGIANVSVHVAFVTRARAASERSECAGVITRWGAALTDPLPAVLRDPGARLARQYRELLSNLVAGSDVPASRRPDHHHAADPIKSC